MYFSPFHFGFFVFICGFSFDYVFTRNRKFIRNRKFTRMSVKVKFGRDSTR